LRNRRADARVRRRRRRCSRVVENAELRDDVRVHDRNASLGVAHAEVARPKVLGVGVHDPEDDRREHSAEKREPWGASSRAYLNYA
jgi:hypothetical protein